MSHNKMNKCAMAVKLGLLVSTGALMAPAMAQDTNAAGATTEQQIEVIQVRGLRASTAASINTKRFAASQVDGITAQDIGKLPDVTIADSLQRITGVQIERVAGEGGPVQIRGLPQIDTTLNGEVFLSATTIDASAADFSDLPSQLFSGVDVFKSGEAKHAAKGIAGSIDLRTRRPFDMDEGFTFAGGAEMTRGSISKENDPMFNAFASFREEKWGLLVSAVTSEATLATDYNGYFDTSENGGIGAANNNHTWGPNPRGENIRHVVPQGFSAFNKTEERERNAFQSSFQADVAPGIELVADYFYTDQERFNARSGFSQNNRWYTFNDYAYPTANGWTGDTFTDKDGNKWGGVNAFYMKPWRLQSFTQVNINEEKSRNLNLQLKFDLDGPLKGDLRMTRADATHRMRHGYGEGDMLSIDKGTLVTGPGQFSQGANCKNGEAIVGANGGCFARFSPGGIESNNFLLTYDASGKHPVFGGFDQIVNGGAGPRSVAAYMADLNSYHVGAFSSEGNTDTSGEINTLSTKWNYEFQNDGPIRSVDFGVRMLERAVDRDDFTYTSTFGNGCDIAQWKAVDQYINGSPNCVGNPAAGEYLKVDTVFDGQTIKAGTWMPYTLLGPTKLDQYTTVSYQTNFGGVSGIPGVWVIDPSNFRDPKAFHEKTFGNVQRVENAGASYDVGLDEFNYFAQANFEHGIFNGNFGIKVVETDLYVKQNLTGANLPHSGLAPDTGDVVTERSYTDYLPSLNINANVTDDVILRAAFSKNMQPLDLMTWGGGKSVGMAINGDCNCLRVVNGNLTGNPSLNPWRSKNYSLSAEYYAGSASMLYLATYKIDIESFTKSGTVMIDEPDLDGIKRGPWPFTTQVQGNGGNVTGLELGGRLALNDVIGDDSFFSGFGLDANYTLSKSEQDAKGIGGKDLPFPGMSEDTYNLVVWYEQGGFSTRLAWNSRSPRLITQGGEAVGGQSLYQDTYSQLDLSIAYDINEMASVYLNGSNITEEFQQTYLEFKSQKAFQNVYEARWTAGVRVKF